MGVGVFGGGCHEVGTQILEARHSFHTAPLIEFSHN